MERSVAHSRSNSNSHTRNKAPHVKLHLKLHQNQKLDEPSQLHSQPQNFNLSKQQFKYDYTKRSPERSDQTNTSNMTAIVRDQSPIQYVNSFRDNQL